MPIEFGIWRIDSGTVPITFGTIDLESRLEEILEKDISIASPNWMIIGRQVHTEWDGRIDLLAIDQKGNLIVIELKRNKTPRDILAQVLPFLLPGANRKTRWNQRHVSGRHSRNTYS